MGRSAWRLSSEPLSATPERLIAAVRRHRGRPSPALLAALVDEVREFSGQEQHDDITAIVARCRG